MSRGTPYSRIGNPDNLAGIFFVGKLDADLAAGGDCEATIWYGSPLAATSRKETVNDWYLPDDEELPAGTKIAAVKIGKIWVVIKAWIEKTFITDMRLGESYLEVKKSTVLVDWAGEDTDWDETSIELTNCP